MTRHVPWKYLEPHPNGRANGLNEQLTRAYRKCILKIAIIFPCWLLYLYVPH